MHAVTADGSGGTLDTGPANASRRRACRWWPATLLGVGVLVEALLVHLGRTYGSARHERTMALPGDDVVAEPSVVTNHAITIDAPPECVWPWLVQMGWHRAGWYTARWVDRLLFPANWPSADHIMPELQDLHVGSFIPDGAPETGCGMIVESFEPPTALVLHSTSHLPASWRQRHAATLDWSWAFVLVPIDAGRRTRFIFRSRWVTAPWWFTLGGLLAIVPADFVMGRDMLRGIKQRAEALARGRGRLADPAHAMRSGVAPPQEAPPWDSTAFQNSGTSSPSPIRCSTPRTTGGRFPSTSVKP